MQVAGPSCVPSDNASIVVDRIEHNPTPVSDVAGVIYPTIKLTREQKDRFRALLDAPVTYCQPEGRTTTLKKLLNFTVMGREGLVK